MGFLVSTVLVSAVIIFLVASVLQWIVGKIRPKAAGSVGATVALVAVATLLYMYVMTRPAIVGPYEQFTLENIGGQALAGVLVAGSKAWFGGKKAAG